MIGIILFDIEKANSRMRLSPILERDVGRNYAARPLAITSVKVTTTSLTFPLPSWKKSILVTHSILRRERENGFENLIASTGESTEAISNPF